MEKLFRTRPTPSPAVTVLEATLAVPSRNCPTVTVDKRFATLRHVRATADAVLEDKHIRKGSAVVLPVAPAPAPFALLFTNALHTSRTVFVVHLALQAGPATARSAVLPVNPNRTASAFVPLVNRSHRPIRPNA